MAKEYKEIVSEIPNKKLLENNKEVIIVKNKVEFKMEAIKSPCDNCGNLHAFKTIYETLDNNNVGLCYFCNMKVHNSNTTNPRFIKDENLTLKKQ